MILKERKVPIKIQKLEALLRRLPQTHPKIPHIKEKHATELAGFRGEQSLNYYFQFLEGNEHVILHHIRLPNPQGYHFQIDTLLLTPNFISIVEIKNVVGTLFFDQDFHQLIRTIDDRVESFQCPILQSDRQEVQLRSWFLNNKLPSIPIHSLIVISNPSSIIKTDPKHLEKVKQKVMHAGFFPQKIESQYKIHRNEILSFKDLKKVARIIIKNSTTHNPDYLQYFHIDKSEILLGVHCKKCNQLSMKRRNGTWHCAICKTDNKDAHIDSLKDYSLLFGTTLTNKQLRDFLQISSTSIANKLLNSLHLKYSGDKRGRVYELPNPEE